MQGARRRLLLAIPVLGLASALARAESRRRIGILWEPEGFEQDLRGFFAELAARGWDRGRNLDVVAPYLDPANADLEIGEAIARVVRAQPDVLLIDGTEVTRAVLRAAPQMPLVVTCADPVGSGFARTMVEPGMNITGISQGAREIAGKSLQLLRAIVPRVSRITILYPDGGPSDFAGFAADVARREGMEPSVVLAGDDGPFDAPLRAMAGRGDGAILVGNFSLAPAKRIAELALAHRVPTVTSFPNHVEAGMLLSFRLYDADQGVRFAGMVDKVLRGTNPGKIPFELPRVADLVINRRTAAALKLRIPGEILLRANRVIG